MLIGLALFGFVVLVWFLTIEARLATFSAQLEELSDRDDDAPGVR